ncbi:MAG TPA: ice-binding family protein, partial [Nocardioidaceae bacterium]|nr:ice-binding family protein [Nocardioidaceae bacterium]
MSEARWPRTSLLLTRGSGVAIGVTALLVVGQLATVSASAAPAAAAPVGATFVDLGSAASYSVLGGTSVANTGAGTVLAGDLGLSPEGTITGFPPGTFGGTMHDKDAAAEAAQADRAEAYADAAGQVSTAPFAGDQGGMTFKPGVHTSAAAFTNTGTMTLDADGDSSAVFVFQIGAALSSAAGSKVVLADGALANNVFWQVKGAVSLGAGAKFVGTILGDGAIAFGEGAAIKGRLLTPTSVALTNSPVTEPIDDFAAPIITIDGGATRSTNDTSP